MLKDASKSLEDLKAKRIAARQSALDAAREQRNLNKMLGVPSEPSTSGFVFTAEEIEAECQRHRRILEAKIAQDCNYDRKRFRHSSRAPPDAARKSHQRAATHGCAFSRSSIT